MYVVPTFVSLTCENWERSCSVLLTASLSTFEYLKADKDLRCACIFCAVKYLTTMKQRFLFLVFFKKNPTPS